MAKLPGWPEKWRRFIHRSLSDQLHKLPSPILLTRGIGASRKTDEGAQLGRFMRPEVRVGVCTVWWAVFALSAAAQSAITPAVQVEPPGSPRLRPGEYPEQLFHEPYPAPLLETSEEFREKYLFGDWLGSRSELADQGIRPL